MGIENIIEKIQSGLPCAMLKDREAISRRLEKIRQRGAGKGVAKRALGPWIALEKRVEGSILERDRRSARKPAVTFPDNLPIASKRDEIIDSIRRHQVIIVSGETGSGKSTQIPKMCLEAGRGIEGKIGCTQPRRIAATTIARRIAEELGEELGQSVGYKIRFSDRTPSEAFIKIMTDGILLAETQHDPRLHEYDTLIIDEAHERSLNIDFLLGILRTLLPDRPELRVIITSATLDTEKFSRAFNDAPVVEVGGRMYPVEVEYTPLDPELEDAGEVTYVDMAVKAVDRLRQEGRPGGMLIFMPTEQDVLETCERLEGRHYRGTTVLPLFARLPASEQGRVYSVTGAKIVAATNVAETSLTIPGIKYVIDTGLARISRYHPGTRTTSLPISPVSRSSADQRKGRCGRIQNGICIRLYSREDLESRPLFTPPEILRSNLAEVILRMIYLGLGDIASFPFVDRPGERSIKDGFDLLMELGAIRRDGKGITLTDEGRLMARMPMDPRISRMLIEARKEGCVREVAIIASALSTQDPRERPQEKASQADQIHAPFKDPRSDFITLLNIWKRYHRSWETLKTQNKMRRFCKEHFLSFARMREWSYVHEQVGTILREQRMNPADRAVREISEDLYAGIHRSILSGYLSNIALKKDKNIYQAARGREAMIFPGSTLFNRSSPWIVAAEMVKTSRLFARTVAAIDIGWLEPLGAGLCRSSYSDPHWEKTRGEVRAFERVTLYGLVIVPRRAVSYGPIDPVESHRIFIQSALVEGETQEPFPFLTHNRRLVERLAAMEDKVRRRGILAGEEAIADFYSRNLEGVNNIRALKSCIKERGGDDFLKLKEEDLILSRPDDIELDRFPDHLTVGDRLFHCAYRFSPGNEKDGVTVSIPASIVSRIPAERLDWGVPGLLREKITLLIKGLPKRYRKQLVPVSRTVDRIMGEIKEEDQSLLSTLGSIIYHRFGVDIPASLWSSVEIPDYLKMRVSVINHQGDEIVSGRDLRLLTGPGSGAMGGVDSALWENARKVWEKTGMKGWNGESLPESIALDDRLVAYPGLEPDDGSVNIRLFETQEEALESHRRGVETLLSLHLARDLRFLKKDLALSGEKAEGAAYFGGVRNLEKSLYEGLIRRLFRIDLRTREEFDRAVEALRSDMVTAGKELRDHTLKILEAYRQTRTALHTIERVNRTNRAVLELCEQVRGDLDSLVPEDFAEILPMERLAHIPRYLKALQTRVERGAYDPEKDRAKMTRAERFIKAVQGMTEGLPPYVSAEKKKAVCSFRWMVEEFKVSLFAPELKTSFPVSEKRLEEKRKEIERMV